MSGVKVGARAKIVIFLGVRKVCAGVPATVRFKSTIVESNQLISPYI
jgi:hypothetical protein